MQARAWLALALLLSACGGAAMKRVTVGGHAFDVPEAHLVEDRLPFLPADAGEGLYVLLDPDAPPEARVSVIVSPAADACRFNAPPVVDQLPRACAVARGEAPQPSPGRLTKTPRFPGSVRQFDYKGEDGGVAVACAAREGGGGSCTAIYAWRDLIWDASFDEAQVPRLEAIRAEVAKRLDEWSAGG